jgi:hypothetical protein
MTNPIVMRLRIAAATAPLVLFIAVPYLVVGLYSLGQSIEIARGHALAASDAARGMEVSLYRIQWGLGRSDGGQIVSDQRRQFGHWLELARDRAESDEQRRLIASIGDQASTLFGQLRPMAGSGRDEATERAMLDLHAAISDLISADDSMLIRTSERAQRQAGNMIVVALVAMVLIPWLAYAVVHRASGRLGSGLRAIRQHLEKLTLRAASTALAADPDLAAINEKLVELGCPKPDPMLAESDA